MTINRKMKKKYFWLLAAALISSLMTFSACSSDDVETPAVDPDRVFLSKVNYKMYKLGTDQLQAEITESYIWKNGLLRQKQLEMINTLESITKTTILDEYYTYDEKQRCIEKTVVGGSASTTYTYNYDENGRLTGGLAKSESSETTLVKVTSSTDDGLFQQLEIIQKTSYGTIAKRRYDLTWENGNIVKFTKHFIEPTESDVTVEVAYDNYPSPYSDMPLFTKLFDEPAQMCSSLSKNNPIKEDTEYIYEKGRLVRQKSKNNIISYIYSDGTGQ
jgi:opacity protein-like surface antigen